MGKRQVHAIAVRKPVTFALLALTTALMVTLLYLLSGRAYAADRSPLWELAARMLGARREQVSRDALLAFLMPVIANVLLFMPWGFLAFVGLDSPRRARRHTYFMTMIGALVVAGCMYVYQEFLPTRVTSPPDAIANGAGALAGAALGHARKGMRIRFDF
ncbi:MAG TPA: VanZ family protein [Thermoanaerobaculia bacterium]|jgi:VanZ family protein|nr:VanZ family protein [Thermoanaerobaculia bacterium]